MDGGAFGGRDKMIPDQIRTKITAKFAMGDSVYLDEVGKMFTRKSKNRVFIGHIAEVVKPGADEDDVIISMIYSGGNPIMEVCDIVK